MAHDDAAPRLFEAPRAEPRPKSVTHHGVTLVDDYAWLRADNWQDVMRDPSQLAADIRAYLEAENAYTDAGMADVADLRETLFLEMKARLKQDDSSVPSPDGPFDYYSSYEIGGQYPRLSRRPRGDDRAGETVMLNGNVEAKGKPYWQLSATAHSPNHALFAYAVDDKGSELATVRVRDLATGLDLPDRIEDTRGGMVWSADSTTLFYVRLDENQRPQSVWRHTLGTPSVDDVKIYEEPDAGFFVAIGATQSQAYLSIVVHDHETSEIRLLDLHHVTGEPLLVAARETGHEYGVEHSVGPNGDRLIIQTNREGAEDFKVCEVALTDTSPANWQELVPHQPGRLIIETAVFANYLARLERENGLPRIVIRELETGQEHAIAFDEEAYSLGMDAGYEFDTTLVRFTYSSMTTPAETYDYDMADAAETARDTERASSGRLCDETCYGTSQRWRTGAGVVTVPAGYASGWDGAVVLVWLWRLRDLDPGFVCDCAVVAR
jgi:oligopeptidase B